MILEVKNLTKSYGRHKVIDDLSFSIENPIILALVGPNGSGKSTLMNCMMNLLDYQNGSIQILGSDHKDYNIFKNVSFLKDNTVLYPYLTGYDHLKIICDAQKLDKSRIDEVCDKIGIKEYVHKKVSSYSLGMKQHLLIAMSIMNKPKLILMDEPLNGLDPDSIIETRHLIRELYKDGTTILISSHTLSEIDFITNDILFLSEGKVIYEDIEKYKTIEYRIEFEDLVQKEKFIYEIDKTSWSSSYKLLEDYVLLDLNESQVNDFIKFIYENDIKLKNLFIHRKGAEERYKEIFHK